MPDATKSFDSGRPHIVLNVAHPDSGVHSVAVDADTPMPDLVSALSDGGYLHDLPQSQPSADGVLEKSKPFIDAARDAWMRSGNGTKPAESGFVVGRTGGAMPLAAVPGHSLQIPNLPGSESSLHTHPSEPGLDDKPSDADVKDAIKTHRTVFVLSKSGLMAVDPAGKVTTVYDGTDFLNKKK